MQEMVHASAVVIESLPLHCRLNLFSEQTERYAFLFTSVVDYLREQAWALRRPVLVWEKILNKYQRSF